MEKKISENSKIKRQEWSKEFDIYEECPADDECPAESESKHLKLKSRESSGKWEAKDKIKKLGTVPPPKKTKLGIVPPPPETETQDSFFYFDDIYEGSCDYAGTYSYSKLQKLKSRESSAERKAQEKIQKLGTVSPSVRYPPAPPPPDVLD